MTVDEDVDVLYNNNKRFINRSIKYNPNGVDSLTIMTVIPIHLKYPYPSMLDNNDTYLLNSMTMIIIPINLKGSKH